MPLIPAPPDTFALLTRDEHPDTLLQQWLVETVVGFDAEDGGAYVVGGKNMSGTLTRLDGILAETGFTLAALWEQRSGGKNEALAWARRHIKARYESALPDRDDPRLEAG